MNITGSKILILFFVITILLSACDESSELGLEVQPNSDKIEIFNNFFNSKQDNYHHLY